MGVHSLLWLSKNNQRIKSQGAESELQKGATINATRRYSGDLSEAEDIDKKQGACDISLFTKRASATLLNP